MEMSGSRSVPADDREVRAVVVDPMEEAVDRERERVSEQD